MTFCRPRLVRFRLSASRLANLTQISDRLHKRTLTPLAVLALALPFFLVFACSSAVQAGLTASEVVVAVNGSSANSRTLANHYCKLRSIPSINVIVLNEVPDAETISVADFRDKILRPLLQEVEQRRLANHVQCIAYSADFPTAIDISADLAEVKDLHTVFTKTASINGLTYLYDLVLKSDPAYITPEANFYARRTLETYFTNPGGKESEEVWGDVNLLVLAKEYAKASQAVDQLFEKVPYQFPLKYLSAAYAAEAGQTEKALKRLDEAIALGWTNGTYLAEDVRFEKLRGNEEFKAMLDLLDREAIRWQSTGGFNARSFYAPNGVEFTPNTKQANLGMRYLLSTVLGVTRGLGNSVEQAVESLKRSSSADFTHPEGGFFFSSTLDIRTKTRHPNFSLAVKELRRLGFQAEVIVQEYPRHQTVLGAQLGTPSMDWASSGSKLVPGSIVDNLTSLGGVMTPPKSQTPLTHFIAAGASGSSGTVTEPYSVQFKFPTPYLYVHYAQGLSFAEAFYQSVTGPYQLLIVGDPLCQPFSIAPARKLDDSLRVISADGTVQLKPDLSDKSYFEWMAMADPPAKRRVQLKPSKIALQIDGGNLNGGNIQPTVNLTFDKQPMGYHEVQVILVADDPLKQRSMQTLPVWIGAEDLIELSLVSQLSTGTKAGLKHSAKKGSLALKVELAESAREVTIFHHQEAVKSVAVDEKSFQLELDPQALGLGPVRLQATAKMSDGSAVVSKPLWVEVMP